MADPARAPGHRAGTATVDGAEGAEFRAWPGEGGTLLLEMGGRTWSFLHSLSGSVVWIGSEGDAWSLARHEVVLGQRAKDARGLGRVTSPMPGKVVAVRVAEGQQVHEGDELVVVEAMKMEYAVGAPCDGVVADVRVRAGDSVASDQDLVVVKGGDEEGPGL